ncbi:MAG: type II toxin-antitoxin system HicB family antitoxin, partial [Oscillibacter sp.]
MKHSLDYYMNLNYKVEVLKGEDTDGYVLHCPELPGCITCGETVEEGLHMLEDAKKCWFSACLEDGYPIPEPAKLENFSGQFKLRIPRSLHKRLAEKSTAEGISMNQYCLYLLSKG